MGASMAGHLLDAGHRVVLTTRTAEKADPLLARGATWADDAAAASEGADVVCSMVGYPADVRAVMFGERGVLAHAPAGSLVIDFTSSEPSLAVEIAAAATARGIAALDAPVSGGDVGARSATLSIMVGGAQDAFDRARPLFDSVGSTIVHQGPAGAGQHTKVVNQTLVAASMIGVCEALLYASRAGLDPHAVLRSVGAGAANSWTLQNLAPRILDGDLAPGFYVEHFVKDLGIAVAEAERMGLELRGLSLAKQLYEHLAGMGHQRSGTQALILALAQLNGLDALTGLAGLAGTGEPGGPERTDRSTADG